MYNVFMGDLNKNRCINPYFDRNVTMLIKGIAIIIMFVHHLFTFPSFYIEKISYPNLEYFALYASYTTKVCVALFAFLTGFTYAYCKNKTFKYALKKILQVYIPYWLICFLFMVVALIRGEYVITPLGIILDFLGIGKTLVEFGWYMPVFVGIMLLITVMHNIYDKHILWVILFGVVVATLISSLGLRYLPDNSYITLYIEWLVTYFQIATIGYMCSRYDLFRKILDPIVYHEQISKWTSALILMILVLWVFIQKTFTQSLLIGINLIGEDNKLIAFSMDIVYLPILVYAFANLSKLIKIKPLNIVLIELGKYSLIMWLFHSIFFGISKELFQPMLYFMNYPILVLVWGLAVCYGISRLIDIPVRKLTSLLNR